jgi:transposase
MAVEKMAIRNQGSLFPFTLEDLLPEGHVARLIEAFVSDVGLEALGLSRRGRGERGAPSYAPELLLGAWIYGYFKHIRSSRGLERVP